ncbi:DUF2867 domain-containing protein [Streptomyces capillispiralis]|uniref:DUF2867 domain-containing protein n=1 Tax=Streptomyces capillispiralis TaxID=68182 RepID=UPI0036C5597C
MIGGGTACGGASRRGRAVATSGERGAERLCVGDPLDLWRVRRIEPLRLPRLRAETRLPGPARPEGYVETDAGGRTRYRQRVLFPPRGLPGHAYWWAVSPLHAVVSGGPARDITRAAAKGMAARGNERRPRRVRRRRRRRSVERWAPVHVPPRTTATGVTP